MGLSFGKSAEYFLEVPFWHVFFFTHFFTQFPSVRNGDKFHLIPTNQLWIVYTLLHPPTNPLPHILNGVKSHTNSIISKCPSNANFCFSIGNTPFQNQQSFLFLIYENGDNYIAISDIMWYTSLSQYRQYGDSSSVALFGNGKGVLWTR